MDFANAALTAALVYAFVNWLKMVFPHADPRIIQLLVWASGIGAIFLMGDTVWAHSQVIGGHALDTLNAGSKIVAGILTGTGATVIDRVESTVRNIGQSDTPEPGSQAAPLSIKVGAAADALL